MSIHIDRKLIFNHKGQVVQRLRNTSGGTVNAGAVVIYDTTTLDGFTTTTGQNDEDVAGVCLATVANGAYAEILLMGFTDLLKVDGTTDIAVGDYLTTFTTAGIAAKRSANTSQGQFALALEAYTTNDGNGVINAWIFSPNRVAGATSTWGDNTLLNLGTDSDIALVHRALALNADTTLAGVVEGTADTLATAANSLMIGNITDDGDVHIVVSKAGNSHTAFQADGSTGDTILNAATGQSVDLYVAGTKEYDFSATAVDLNANHLDNAGYLIMNAVTLPASTEVYIGQDNAGDATVNALTGKSVNLAVAGTDVATFAGAAITFSQAVTLSGSTDMTVGGNLTVTGSLTFGGNWTVGATLTVDELILDTDGVAPAGTNCYWVRDNAGDLTGNAITGKQVIVAINNTDEYTYSATIADFLDNAIDNAGYLILNAATAPAATEVYAVNDNTGDLTVNALTGKTVNVAVNGVDEFNFGATSVDLLGNHLDNSGYLILNAVTNPAGTEVFASHDNTGDLTLNAKTGKTINLAINAVDIAQLSATALTFPATINFAGFATGSIVFNDGAADVNLRVEGTNNANMIVVDAGTDNLALGAGVTAGSFLTVAADNVDRASVSAVARGLYFPASTFNDTVGAGTIAVAPIFVGMRTPTLTATNAVTYTAATSVYIEANPTASTNVTITKGYALLVDGGVASFDGGVYGVHNTSAGDLTLSSTDHATKGAVTIADGEQGLKIGGVPDRATTEGTNQIVLVNGTAPVGLLTNAVTLYSASGEFYAMDAAGNATLNSPHSEDGDFIIHSYSAKKDKTVRVHLEKLLRRLAQDPRYADLVEERVGMAYNHEW